MNNAHARSRSLHYEPLESREMMAVSATLKGGILIVKGTKHADHVDFSQNTSIIAINGVKKTFAVDQVSSIVIGLGKGSDSVSLDSLANGGTQSLAESISVTSNKNEVELVHLANGHDVTLNGAGHALTIAISGAATLDGQLLSWDSPTPPPPPDPANWFDSNILDTALRSLGHSLYSDGLIDRNDMISLLRNAEDDGVIDSTELSDLNAIVSNTTLFGNSDDVRMLSSYIVTGNFANAKYQGQVLGNLAAGSTASQMETLIDKWLLGLDHPVANGTYQQVSGTLFVGGPAYTDIHQGELGDCYFVASLAETALKDPSVITSMFVVNGDGTYTVRFYNSGVAEYVTVDSYLPTSSGGQLIYADYGARYDDANNELWTALAEKAYAQINEMGWLRGGLSGSGQNSYSAIESGYIFAALGQITGQSTLAFTFTGSETSFTSFQTAYNQGNLIGFASYSAPASPQVIGSHAYAVVGCDAANQTITLFNPWGIEYGLVTMNWSQVQSNFFYFDQTV